MRDTIFYGFLGIAAVFLWYRQDEENPMFWDSQSRRFKNFGLDDDETLTPLWLLLAAAGLAGLWYGCARHS